MPNERKEKPQTTLTIIELVAQRKAFTHESITTVGKVNYLTKGYLLYSGGVSQSDMTSKPLSMTMDNLGELKVTYDGTEQCYLFTDIAQYDSIMYGEGKEQAMHAFQLLAEIITIQNT